MPKLTAGNDAGMQQLSISGSGFKFSGARFSKLKEMEYTLVDICVDTTGSTTNFVDQLNAMLTSTLQGCQKSPRRNNILVRVTEFSTAVGGIREIHGYKKLMEIDPVNDYPPFRAAGATPLYDAGYGTVGANVEYGKELIEDDDRVVNGVVYIISDGKEGDWTGSPVSKATPKMIAERVRAVREEEALESLLTFVIGINAKEYKTDLEAFVRDAEIDRYMDAGDVTPESVAKTSDFISQSVSSQAQAAGTGSPSQSVPATI